MKSKYRCRECGEDLPGLSISAKTSNVGTVDELVHHFDPCNCKYHQENENLDKIYELEQENAKLKAKLNSIEEGLKRLEKHLDDGWYIIKDDGYCNLRFDPGCPHPIDLAEYAPTLSLLIDKILTGG